jgi:hypothetical protein
MVAHGLFVGLAHTLVVGTDKGTEVVHRPASSLPPTPR